MEKVRVGVAGITGRMGSTLVRVALETPGIALGAASSHNKDELVVGRDAGLFSGGEESGVAISGSLEYCHEDFDVAIDFTCPEYTVELARYCAEQGKGLVIGTTAHDEEQLEAIAGAAGKIPIVIAPNMSIGVNLMLNLVTEAAKALGDETDTDIVELHHRKKHDAPSGTALALGKAVAKGRGGQAFPDCASFKALSTGDERDADKIQYHIMRMANVVGEHRVVFAWNNEQMELVHRAGSREIFASGAMRAAAWVTGRSPGLYSMQDVLAVLD